MLNIDTSPTWPFPFELILCTWIAWTMDKRQEIAIPIIIIVQILKIKLTLWKSRNPLFMLFLFCWNFKMRTNNTACHSLLQSHWSAQIWLSSLQQIYWNFFLVFKWITQQNWKIQLHNVHCHVAAINFMTHFDVLQL